MSASRPAGEPQHPDEPAAQVFVDPIELTPGVAADVRVEVLNLGAASSGFKLAVRGLEPEWVVLPPDLGPIEPGQRAEAVVRLHLPPAHPPSRLVATITARPIPLPYDWATSAGNGAAPRREPPGRPGQADLIVTVGNGNLIGAALEPAEVRGTYRGRFDVVLRNRGRAPLRVDLFGRAADPGVGVEFQSGTAVLAPGEEARVRSRVHGPRPVVGHARRRPFNVRVQGRGTPVLMEGSFTQRPVFPAWLLKTLAIVCVVALWVSVAAVGISALGKHINKTAAQKSVANAPPLPAPNIPGAGKAKGAAAGARGAAAGAPSKAKGAVAPGTTNPKAGAPSTSSSAGSKASPSGSGSSASKSAAPGSAGKGGGSASGASGSASGGSGSGSGGSGSSGTSASGGSGSASGGSGSGASAASQAPTAGVVKGARVSGRLSSPQPGGVTVTIAPTSLVAASSQDANLTSSVFGGRTPGGPYEVAKISSTANHTPIGKVYGNAAGASFNAALTAATTPTQTTTTAPDGTWAFAGLRAPDEYLVTFSKAGYQTAKYIVTTTNASSTVTLSAALTAGHGMISGTVLGPGGPLGDASITLTDGKVTASTKTPTVGSVGSWSVSGLNTPDTYLITAKAPGFAAQTALVKLGAGGTDKGVSLTLQPGVGTITGTVTSSRTGAGVGGVRVTASSGRFKLSATTTTVSPVGSYTLPNLPMPASYTLTVSGVGWVSQTQQVLLSGNPVVNATLTPSSGDVNGVALASTGGGLAGAGVVLANDKNTFKTLTESAAPVGGFDFGQVPAGHYVLTIEDFGYTTQSAQVTVVDGTTQTVDLTLPFVGSANENTAIIEGSVSDFLNATPIAGAKLTLDGDSKLVGTTTSGGTYQIANVGPGVHTVTATAKGYESASVQVSVTLGGVAFAPPILLPIEDSVGGIVVSNAGGIVPDPAVQLVNPATGAIIAATTSPPGTPTLTGVPAPALGGFEIDDVPHGNYLMKISAPPANGCGTEAFVAAETPVTVALGTNLILTGALSPALNLAPSFNVITLQASPSSLPTQVGGVTVTVTDTKTGQATTCDSPTPPTTPGATPTDLTFPDLINGDPYRADFSLQSGGTVVTAPPVSFTAALNNAAIDTVILAPPAQGVSISLLYAYRTPAAPGGTTDCPLETAATSLCPALPAADLPTVQMTGTVGYVFPNPGQPAAPVERTFTAQPPRGGSDVWSFPAASLNGLLPSSVTFTVSDPGGAFEQFTKTDNTGDNGFANQSLLLNPTPAPTPCLTITPASGVSVTTTPTITGLSLTESTGTAECPANGSVIWNDTASATPGSVEPGVYALDFSAGGFDPQSANPSTGLLTVTIPFEGATCPAGHCTATRFNDGAPLDVTLVAHVSLSVTPSYTPPDPSLGLGYPTVTLADANGTIGTVNLSATQSTATFDNLSIADTTLNLTIRQGGYKTLLQQPVTLHQTPPANAVNPSLVEEGWVVGQVLGRINTTTQPLAGVSVQAAVDGALPAGCTTRTSPVAISDANGRFVLTGDPTGRDGGLCPGAAYNVAPANSQPPTGYQENSFNIRPMLAGPNTGVADTLTLTAVPVTETVHVTSSAGAHPAIGGASVVALSGVGLVLCADGTAPLPPPTLCAATGQDPPGTAANPAVTDSNGDATIIIDPTSYTFQVSAANYNSVAVGPVPFSPTNGAASVLNVQLTPVNNVITGTLTVHSSTGAGVPVPAGVSVTLTSENGSGGVVATTATDNTGTFLFSQTSGGGVIQSGNYLLSASLPGYSYYQPPQVFATASPVPGQTVTTTVENLQFQADLVSVDVGTTSTLSQSAIVGTTVSLSPTRAGADTCSSSTGDLLATGLGVAQQLIVSSPTTIFRNVVPDWYTLDISGPGLPTQTAQTIEVCPGTTASPTFVVQEGQISGTVSVPSPDGFSLASATIDIKIFAFSGTTEPQGLLSGTPTTTVTCPASNCSYSAIVALNSNYAVQATLDGFTSPSTDTGTLAGPNTYTATFSPSLTALSHTVKITVNSSAPGVSAPSSAIVTLTGPSGVLPAPTFDGNGVFEFDNVTPEENGSYDIVAKVGDATEIDGTVQVPVEPTVGNDPIQKTVSGDFGSIAVTVAAADGGDTSSAQITITNSTGGTYQPPTPRSSWTDFVDVGAYTVSASLPGYVTATQPVTLTDGSPTQTVPLTLQPQTHTVRLTVESNDPTAPLAVPGTASVTLGTQTGTPLPTAGVFEFTGVAPGSYTATATFAGLTLSGTVVIPVTATDPLTPTLQLNFGELSGTITLSAAQTTNTTVTVELCSSQACSGNPQPVATVAINAGSTTGQYSQFLAAGTTGFLAFAASGFTAPAPVSVTVQDADVTGTAENPTLTVTPPPGG